MLDLSRLDSYDANGDASRDLLEKSSLNAHDSTFGHSNECMDTDADVADDDGTTRPSNLGVAVLRYHDARLSVDTSLLSQQDSSFGHAATDLPSTGVQFEINHWYQVIGDICYTQHVRQRNIDIRKEEIMYLRDGCLIDYSLLFLSVNGSPPAIDSSSSLCSRSRMSPIG